MAKWLRGHLERLLLRIDKPYTQLQLSVEDIKSILEQDEGHERELRLLLASMIASRDLLFQYRELIRADIRQAERENPNGR